MSTGDDIRLEKIELIPGAYAPQAVVHLRVAADKPTAAPRPPDLILQLRLEWGDWYVAELQTVGLAG
jgi:hypothetical protein